MAADEVTALSTAQQLASALNENTKALEKVRRRNRIIGAVAIVALVLILFVLKTRHDGEVHICQASNAVIHKADDKFEKLATRIIESTPPDRVTPQTQSFIVLLQEDLPRQDCDHIGWLRP